MSYLKAEVFVNDEPRTIEIKNFYCRDALIPAVFSQLRKLREHGVNKLSARGENGMPYFELGKDTKRRYDRGLDWDELMGINHRFSPIASPYLLRFYIGRIRNGYKYDWMEQALRRAHREGVDLVDDLSVAWDLTKTFAMGLGLDNIKPYNSAWGYNTESRADFARIFPPYIFIERS